LSEQGKKFRQFREKLTSALRRTELNIASLQFQLAEVQIQDINDLYNDLIEIANPDSEIQQRALQRLAAEIQNAEAKIRNGLERREAGKRENG
jgi:hypothetical protein